MSCREPSSRWWEFSSRVNLRACSGVIVFLLAAQEGWAHGGGTDANGCHRDRQSNTFHCHDGAAASDSREEHFTGEPRLIDGDTFDLDGVRIRLHGIDAPEIAATCESGGTKLLCGQSALLALAGRLEGRSVTCRKRGTDRYGRVVAKCYEGGEDLGAWMVRNGWARAFRRYSRDYVADEIAARDSGTGIWGDVAPPW